MTYGPNVRELYRSLAGYVDPDSARHCARRSAVPGADQVRAGDQSQDREGAWAKGGPRTSSHSPITLLNDNPLTAAYGAFRSSTHVS